VIAQKESNASNRDDTHDGSSLHGCGDGSGTSEVQNIDSDEYTMGPNGPPPTSQGSHPQDTLPCAGSYE
jgi:hypothetical protein